MPRLNSHSTDMLRSRALRAGVLGFVLAACTRKDSLTASAVESRASGGASVGSSVSVAPQPISLDDFVRECQGRTVDEIRQRWAYPYGHDRDGEVHFLNSDGWVHEPPDRRTNIALQPVVAPDQPGRRVRHFYMRLDPAPSGGGTPGSSRATSCRPETSDMRRFSDDSAGS